MRYAMQRHGKIIESMKIADRTESDHKPIELTLEVQMEVEEEKKKEEGREIEDWTEDGCRIQRQS